MSVSAQEARARVTPLIVAYEHLSENLASNSAYHPALFHYTQQVEDALADCEERLDDIQSGRSIVTGKQLRV